MQELVDTPVRRRAAVQVKRRTLRVFRLAVSIIVAFTLLGSGTVDFEEAQLRRLAMTSAGQGFDLVSWEVSAVSRKLASAFASPAAGLSREERKSRVLAYLEATEELYRSESELARLYAEGEQSSADAQQFEAEIVALRAAIRAERPVVEKIIEEQVSEQIAVADLDAWGVVVPPVQFAFTEPPKKLVVSPRERIETHYTRMLSADTDLAKREAIEREIEQQFGYSAYITTIGGLGAYPSIVVDRASLEWILSTVAHEWVHNYLTMFPLGLNYFASDDMTTINETVAEIVGNEVGAAVVRERYPEFAPPPIVETGEGEPEPVAPPEPPAFDFVREMRQTRLVVDELLALGFVEAAEAYMETRRQTFIEHGYPLRVLNQAYFAFHGSYGTGAASTSPIGPKLQQLRAQSGDLQTFLETVRWFTGADDLERALGEAPTEFGS